MKRNFSITIDATERQWELVDELIKKIESRDTDSVIESVHIPNADITNGVLNNAFTPIITVMEGGLYYQLTEDCDVSDLTIEWRENTAPFCNGVEIWKRGQ